MTLSLYNTLTREKSAFQPMNPANVRMYACGPTVYDFAHIGNARMVVVFDVLFRVLSAVYPRVTYVRNVTDIDDKIINAAIANAETIGTLTARTEKQFNEDMAAVGCLMPTHTPRATEYVPQMLSMIGELIKNGHAYEGDNHDGHVWFDVSSMPSYGSLSSNRNIENAVTTERVKVGLSKHDAVDFVLWKPSTDEQPGWDSPYGRGRPGWHIECSAMSGALLGDVFDIHGGGIDLIFPHHENEIAQSCCAHGTDKLANVWVHNGFITVNGEKMSKSLGNFFTVHDLLKDWDGEVIRYALLSAHYRQPLDFTNELLAQSKAALDRMYLALRGREVSKHENLLAESGLLNDLDTSAAMTKLHEWTTELNKGDDSAADKIKSLGAVMGLLQKDPEMWFQGSADTAAIDAKVAARVAAKKNKDFKTADAIRDELTAMGIILEDSAAGTTWRRA